MEHAAAEVDLLGYARNQPDAVAVVEMEIVTVDEVHEVRAATAELAWARIRQLTGSNTSAHVDRGKA